MKPILSLFAAFGVVFVAAESQLTYSKFQVLRVVADTEASIAELQKIVTIMDLDTWKMPRRVGESADILVPPSKVPELKHRVKGKEVVVMHGDLGASMIKEYTPANPNDKRNDLSWFNSFHPYKDHLAWLRSLQANFTENSEIVSSGNSSEGKTITGIRIYGDRSTPKPAVILHSTVHAREWASTMVNEYIAYTLLNGSTTDTEIRGFVNKYDFYIFPVVNPDGFMYSQMTDRMWRKNRQKIAQSECVGIDINRNWPWKWSNGKHTSGPCYATYRGEFKGSAQETKSMMKFINSVKQEQGLKLFIDWHAYGQLFMSPSAYSCDAKPKKHREYLSLARGAADAIEAVHGTQFKSGPVCSTLYPVTGTAVDYVNDVVEADYTFTAELRDSGNHGFVLPPEEILPTGEETFAGVLYLLRNMR